jgi:hypothetical protein
MEPGAPGASGVELVELEGVAAGASGIGLLGWIKGELDGSRLGAVVSAGVFVGRGGAAGSVALSI